MAAVACSTEPAAETVAEHKTSEGEKVGDSRALPMSPSEPTTAPPTTTTTTTVEATTPTTEPEPEPVATTVVTAPPVTRRTTATTAYVEPPSPQGRSTRGDTPPEYIKQCESGGDYGAVNSSSGAGGAWQFMPGTWRSVGGTGLPQNATPAEQDYRASILWAGGAGASHWDCA